MNTYSKPAFTCRIRTADQSEALTMQTFPLTVDFIKLPALSHQRAFKKSLRDQGYAVSLFRPFALRARITALPARVLILSRHPWVRLRFKLLG